MTATEASGFCLSANFYPAHKQTHSSLSVLSQSTSELWVFVLATSVVEFHLFVCRNAKTVLSD